eukprot:12421885-Karenia_brevis.AAC.1
MAKNWTGAPAVQEISCHLHHHVKCKNMISKCKLGYNRAPAVQEISEASRQNVLNHVAQRYHHCSLALHVDETLPDAGSGLNLFLAWSSSSS